MKTKAQQIVDLLKDGEWHPMRELNAICYRYGARIDELNEILSGRGKEIVNKRNPQSREFWYRMQPRDWPFEMSVVKKRTVDETVQMVLDVFKPKPKPVDSIQPEASRAFDSVKTNKAIKFFEGIRATYLAQGKDTSRVERTLDQLKGVLRHGTLDPTANGRASGALA